MSKGLGHASLFLKNKFIGMKNKLFLFLFLPLVTAFIGCGSSNGPGDVPPITTLTVSPEAVSLTAEGTAVSVNVSANHEWGSAVSDSWIKVTPSNAVKDAVVTIAADPNVDTNPRTGTVTFMAGSARKVVTVEQAAADTAATWAKGLADWGIDKARMQKLAENVSYAIYSPGSNSAIPVSILSSLKCPQIPWEENKEMLRENISSTVTALLELVGQRLQGCLRCVPTGGLRCSGAGDQTLI